MKKDRINLFLQKLENLKYKETDVWTAELIDRTIDASRTILKWMISVDRNQTSQEPPDTLAAQEENDFFAKQITIQKVQVENRELMQKVSALEKEKVGWIPVGEFTPNPGKHYFALCSFATGKLTKCVVTYTDGWDIEVDAEGDEPHLNHKPDYSFLPQGWYELCEQEGGNYDEFYFKRDVHYILDITLPEALQPTENDKTE